jgi:hypothetical protein
VKIEIDLDEDTAGHAGFGDAEVELGAAEMPPVSFTSGHVVAAAVGGARVADEQAVEQLGVAEAAVEELPEASVS